MKLNIKDIPRTFAVGIDRQIEIQDMGDIYLAPNEQLTLVTEGDAHYDIVRKDWGFYATPSINGRLVDEGFKTALVRNQQGRIYIMVVEKTKIPSFENYCQIEQQTILKWLDEYPCHESSV